MSPSFVSSCTLFDVGNDYLTIEQKCVCNVNENSWKENVKEKKININQESSGQVFWINLKLGAASKMAIHRFTTHIFSQTCTWSWRTLRDALWSHASWMWSWANRATIHLRPKRNENSRSESTLWWRRWASWSSAWGWVRPPALHRGIFE